MICCERWKLWHFYSIVGSWSRNSQHRKLKTSKYILEEKKCYSWKKACFSAYYLIRSHLFYTKIMVWCPWYFNNILCMKHAIGVRGCSITSGSHAETSWIWDGCLVPTECLIKCSYSPHESQFSDFSRASLQSQSLSEGFFFISWLPLFPGSNFFVLCYLTWKESWTFIRHSRNQILIFQSS